MKLTLEMLEPHRQRKAAYQTVFKAPYANTVLADLAKFCNAFESCAVPGDHDSTMLNEGKRLVWLRIQKHLNFTPAELAVHYDAVLSIPD